MGTISLLAVHTNVIVLPWDDRDGSWMALCIRAVFKPHSYCVDGDIHARTSYQLFYLQSIRKNQCTFLSHICYAWLTAVKSTYQTLGNFSQNPNSEKVEIEFLCADGLRKG